MNNLQSKTFDALLEDVGWLHMLRRLNETARQRFGDNDELTEQIDRAEAVVERRIEMLGGRAV